MKCCFIQVMFYVLITRVLLKRLFRFGQPLLYNSLLILKYIWGKLIQRKSPGEKRECKQTNYLIPLKNSLFQLKH